MIKKSVAISNFIAAFECEAVNVYNKISFKAIRDYMHSKMVLLDYLALSLSRK